MSSTESAPQKTVLLGAGDVSRTVARIAHQIIEKTHLASEEDAAGIVLLGIPSGGVPLADRLADRIESFTGGKPAVGSLDITLYRDDIGRGPHRALKKTSIPLSGIDGKTVILVDDVLYSGRTIRAALDAIADVGRPAIIQLAVLVDRGHRQLPIRADYVGKNIPTSRHEDVIVTLREIDGDDEVALIAAPAAPAAPAGSAGASGDTGDAGNAGNAGSNGSKTGRA